MLSIRPNSIWLEKQIHNIYFYHIILHYIQLSSVKVKNKWRLREIFCIRSWDEVGEIVYLWGWKYSYFLKSIQIHIVSSSGERLDKTFAETHMCWRKLSLSGIKIPESRVWIYSGLILAVNLAEKLSLLPISPSVNTIVLIQLDELVRARKLQCVKVASWLVCVQRRRRRDLINPRPLGYFRRGRWLCELPDADIHHHCFSWKQYKQTNK